MLVRPGRVAEWLAHSWSVDRLFETHCCHTVISLGMNPVDALQCCLSMRSATCNTWGGSQEMYIHYICLCNANKAELTLALKPRGDVTRNPKQGCQWPQNRTCEYVWQKYFKKKKKFNVGCVFCGTLNW